MAEYIDQYFIEPVLLDGDGPHIPNSFSHHIARLQRHLDNTPTQIIVVGGANGQTASTVEPGLRALFSSVVPSPPRKRRTHIEGGAGGDMQVDDSDLPRESCPDYDRDDDAVLPGCLRSDDSDFDINEVLNI